MAETEDLKKSLDPVTVVAASAAVVAAYPAAKEIIQDIRNARKNQEQKSN